MTSTLLFAVARKAEALTPDAELLERFIGEKDQLAFEELVRRHGPLVWGVCRNLLPHHADAEDAFQAVFLALVRSARSIRDGRTVPAWLHGVAVRIATRLKRTAVRRRQREQIASVPEADRPVPDAAWESLVAAVHEEVQCLPEAERTAFVLCDLQGVPQADAATRLGWPLGSLSGRLCKARQRLLEKLTARGVAPGVVVGVGITAGSASAVPASLFDVVKVFPASPTAASIAATALARGLTEGLTMRAKLMVVTAVVVAAFGLTGGAMVLSKADAQPTVPSGGGGGGSGGGSAPVGAPPGAGVGGPGVPGAPGGAPPGVGGLPGSPDGGPGALPGGGGAGGFAVGPAAWEYKFVDVKNDRKAFEKAIVEQGKDGWEFCSSERFAQNDLVLVFKKRKGGDFPFGGGGGGRFGGFGAGGFDGPGIGGAWRGFGPGGGVDFGGGEVEARVFKLKNAKAVDVVAPVEKLPVAKGQFLKVVAEPKTNPEMVIIIADPTTMKTAIKLIEELDAKGKPAPKGPGGPGGLGGPSFPGPMGLGAPGGPPGGAKPGGMLHIVTLEHATAEEMTALLKQVFRGLEVTPEGRTNRLVIRADEDTLADALRLIQDLDVAVPKKR